jgi:single-stranded-DNA-specific exonuclease
VAFKLVQALQTKLAGMPQGHEKCRLDLVALGTVCDIVPLLNENRNNTHWGIEVLKKTRRPGLKALIAVTKLRPSEINAHKIGFVLGPRLNAAGRVATAKSALELLMTNDNARALELAQNLDALNSVRRSEQDKIFAEAQEKVGQAKDPVIIVGDEGWNEGVIGIVASKLMEKYSKPAFVLSIGDEIIKGSGRSFGDFNIAEAIAATNKHIEKGGGHAAAGGVTIKPENYEKWRDAIYKFYTSLHLENQNNFLTPSEDIEKSDLAQIQIELVEELTSLEPFGMGNERPIFRLMM